MHGGGVAGAISRAGGPADRLRERAAAPDRARRGGLDLRWLDAVPWVIHAATMELGGPTSADVIRRATASTLASPMTWAPGLWRWSRSGRASAASRSTRPRGSRSTRSGPTSPRCVLLGARRLRRPRRGRPSSVRAGPGRALTRDALDGPKCGYEPALPGPYAIASAQRTSNPRSPSGASSLPIVTSLTSACGGPIAQERDHPLDRARRTLEHRLDRPVTPVAHPPVDACAERRPLSRVPEANSLHTAMNDDPPPYPLVRHARILARRRVPSAPSAMLDRP